ncbi:hypothetical protein BH23ACT9_BH23ACT9_28840 [soil metagenome]
MRRSLAAVMLSLMSLAVLAPVAGALSATDTVDADRADYICIRSHVLLGKDNPICIKYTPPNGLQ